MKKISFFIGLIFCCYGVFSQRITAEQYVQTYKENAMREMKRMGVPAAITLAQGILETESGNSELVKKSNNHFGIKCKSSWTAGGVSHDDDALGECFRSYKNAEASYRDHSNYLRGNERYAFLFKLDPQDYRGWAYGLRKAGYATNPRYPEMLIKHIEQNNLQQYTMLAVNDVPFFDASKYKNDPEEKAFNDIVQGNVSGNIQQVNNTSYSLKEKTEINGSKAIYETKGRSLLAIATENNISLHKLLEYNDLEKDGLLEKDQLVFLEKKSKEGNKDFYVVQKNETIYDVAQKNGIRLSNLYEYNSLRIDEKIYAGSKLKLRELKIQPSIIKAPPVNEQIKTYEVQSREGLYTISKKYGVSVAQLKEWNNLTDDNLKVGQQIIVSK